ncbi:ABC transporter substrate-binding protein [Bacillus piscicola]|uniref:ABC transporter substrate-binding protein n=1 Tax=Bacillus piscicola TaxID=1632684 RepID=UPI001F08C601|nr:ABC transporter substrate-binding protein [Bacillus piscicola]
MRKRCAAFIAVMFITWLSACGGESTGNENGEQAVGNPEENLEEFDVMLDWYPNAVHSFLYVAKEKGYFTEEGLNVNIQFPANTTDPLNLAAAGKVDLGFYYQPDVISARANEGIAVKSTGAIVRSPLNHIVFKDEKAFESPKDLEGKQVGYPGIALNEALLRTIVKEDGGDPDKVEMIDVGFELGSALIADKTDAVIGAYVNHEVPVLEHQGHEVDYFNPVDYGVPEYYELTAVTSDETWKTQETEIKAFWRAAKKGFAFMEENPEEALQILLDNQDEANFPLEKAVEQKSLEILLPKMTAEEDFSSQSLEVWEETAEWLKDTGMISEIPENMSEMIADPS